MASLRWILFIFGIGVIAAVFLYSRGWLQSLLPRERSGTRRRDPLLFDLEGADEPDARRPELVPELTAEVEPPAAASDIEAVVDDRSSKIIAIRLLPKSQEGFPGEDLVRGLREAGLRFGEFDIFHRQDARPGAQTSFSVASLVEPGSFDLTNLQEVNYPGISLFIVLPGPGDPLRAFDEMLSTARTLAQSMDGDLFDESGSTLSVQRERYMREELIEYQHRTTHATALYG